MNRSILLAGLIVFSVWAMPAIVFAQSLIACSLISEKDALALVGGPLGEIAKGETKPTAQNANIHHTNCGFFPKGFDMRTATRPPERGLELRLQAKRNNADAQKLYEGFMDDLKEMAKTPRKPFTGEKLSPLSDMGVSATLHVRTIELEPKAVYHVTSVYFLKGSVMGIVNVWQTAVPGDESTRAAAKQVIAKLP